MTSSDDPDFDAKVQDVCPPYREAPARAKEGIGTVSTDELTGVQALERLHPGLPMVPGTVARRAVAYIRRGMCAFILKATVLSFLDDDNRTMARPFTWTYEGKPRVS